MPIFRTVRQAFTRPQAAVEADVERQQAHPLESTAAQDASLHDRATPSQSLPPLPLLTALPFFAPSAGGRTRQEAGSSPRPTSSRYSVAADDSGGSPVRAVLSPKTPQFPTSHEGLPSETTAPGAGTVPVPLAVPLVAVIHDGDQSSRRHRRWFRGADPAEVHLADLADAGRRRRRRQQEQRVHNNQQPEGPSSSSSSTGPAPMAPPPAAADAAETATATARGTAAAADKRFLFCFPAVRSRRMRAHILRCCVSGLFVALMLAVYAGLSVTHNVTNSEFSVLLVLVLVAAAVVFVHSLVRLALGLARPPSAADEAAAEARYQLRRRTGRGGRGTVADGPAALGFGQHYGAGGYALPRQPIRVVLARDEEVAGAASEAAKLQPPAYGLWRESVRVDPNRLYWQRNDAPAALGAIPENPTAGNGLNTGRSRRQSSSSSSSGDRESVHGRSSPRPPSYASDDGVRYVVEAQPRSIAPTTDVPLPPHPAEAARTVGPAAW